MSGAALYFCLLLSTVTSCSLDDNTQKDNTQANGWSKIQQRLHFTLHYFFIVILFNISGSIKISIAINFNLI